MPASFRIRPATQADGAFLGDMVVEAANWREGGARPRHEVIAHPDHHRYLAGWMRPGDAGFVAVDAQDQPIGAAWYRTLPRTDPDLSLVPSAWSPDGSRIAFEGWDENNPDRTGIYTARASDGADLVRVTELPGVPHDSPLEYSPDGRQLVFFRATHPDPDYTDGSLWVVNVDGSGARQITSDATPPNVWARWSPDGARILFGAERFADTGPLWTATPDGKDLRTVYTDKDGGFVLTPDWSPDGTQIVFALDPHNDEYAHPPNKVYIINADGTNLQLVNDSNDFKRALEWTD